MKAGSTQAATETKENGVPADASPKMSGSANKKSRKSRLFFKSKEVKLCYCIENLLKRAGIISIHI